MSEEWRDIPEHPGYQASNLGRVRSVDRVVTQPGRWGGIVERRLRGQVLQPKVQDSGHLFVQLPGKRYRKVHQLVLEAFVGPCPPGLEACHGNGNPADNRSENLRWDTRPANRLDSVRHGTHPMASRPRCPLDHLLVAPNLIPSQTARGHRSCIACNRAHAQAQRLRVKGEPVDFRTIADAKYAEIMAGAA